MGNVAFLLLAVFASLGLGSKAHAVEAFRVEISRFETRVHGPFYEVNESAGRAWLSIAIGDFRSDSGGGEGSEPPNYVIRRGLVAGMSYDPATRLVMWNGIPCARLSSDRWRRFEATGRCQLSTSLLDSAVDNGFEVRRVRHALVSIDGR